MNPRSNLKKLLIEQIKEQVQNTKDFSYPGVIIFSSEYYNFNPTLYLEIFSEKDKK